MRTLIFIWLLIHVVFCIGAEDRLYISNVDTDNLNNGNLVEVEVLLDNDRTYCALQTDIYLTEGLEMVQDEYGYVCMLTNRATNNHIINVHQQQDGAIRVFVTTQSSRAIKGNSGAIFTMQIKATPDFDENDHISLVHNIVTEEDATKHIMSDFQYNLFIVSEPCDVNNDGEINVGDVNNVLNLILLEAYETVADVNRDDLVNIGDVNTILSEILKR